MWGSYISDITRKLRLNFANFSKANKCPLQSHFANENSQLIERCKISHSPAANRSRAINEKFVLEFQVSKKPPLTHMLLFVCTRSYFFRRFSPKPSIPSSFFFFFNFSSNASYSLQSQLKPRVATLRA